MSWLIGSALLPVRRILRKRLVGRATTRTSGVFRWRRSQITTSALEPRTRRAYRSDRYGGRLVERSQPRSIYRITRTMRIVGEIHAEVDVEIEGDFEGSVTLMGHRL